MRNDSANSKRDLFGMVYVTNNIDVMKVIKVTKD